MPALHRYDVYRMWRVACDVCVALRQTRSGALPDAARLDYALLLSRIEQVRGRLAPQAARLDALPPDTEAMDLARTVVARDQLAAVAMADRDEIGFASLHVSVGAERAILDAALQLDGLVTEGFPIPLRTLAEHARLDLDVVRQGACQWLDEGLVRFARDKLQPEGETIVVLDHVLTRGESWFDYRWRRDREARSTP